jgi:uncharacterized Zn finger protein
MADFEKGCPYCGLKEDLEIDDVTTEAFAVCCGNCGAIGPQALTREDAVACFNSRI